MILLTPFMRDIDFTLNVHRQPAWLISISLESVNGATAMQNNLEAGPNV